MTPEQFSSLAASRFRECGKTMVDKAQEYSRNGDRLHNFKRAELDSQLLGLLLDQPGIGVDRIRAIREAA